MRVPRRAVPIALVVVAVLAGCHREEVVVRAPSPTGGGEALVVERAWLDPPDQTLVLEPPDHRQRLVLRHLAPDGEACSEIAWSPDGGRVAFVVSGRQLLVYDSGGNPVTEVELLAPGSGRFARHVALSADGRRVAFDACVPGGGESWTCDERRTQELGAGAGERNAPIL